MSTGAIIIVIVLLVALFGGFGWWASPRPGWTPAGAYSPLGLLVFLLLAYLLLRALGAVP